MNSPATVSEPAGLEYLRYFPRQLITAEDMRAEQAYFREKLRRHNRLLHGWGVVCGCEVRARFELGPQWVSVSPGFLITPGGDEIEIPQRVDFDLAGDWRQPYAPCVEATPCSPATAPVSSAAQTVYLAACYMECNTRPVRVQSGGCGCDDAACEYSRVRESFELVRLDQLPDAYAQADRLDIDWKDWLAKNKAGPLPACPQDTCEDCVVLATIQLPATAGTLPFVRYDHRRVLRSSAGA